MTGKNCELPDASSPTKAVIEVIVDAALRQIVRVSFLYEFAGTDGTHVVVTTTVSPGAVVVAVKVSTETNTMVTWVGVGVTVTTVWMTCIPPEPTAPI